MIQRFWAILITITFIYSSGVAEESQVPETWLDSLAANTWRMDSDPFSSYRMKVIMDQLDKNGETKGSYTEYMYIEVVDGVEKDPVRTDENGIPIPEEKKKKKKQEEESEANPFEMFDKKNRDRYTYSIIEPDDFGRVRIQCRPLKKLDDLFDGIATIDTLYWVPVKVEGKPAKLPKMVKEMEMSLEVGPSKDGYFQINKMDTNVVAKFLLLKFRMKMHTTFYDYQYVEE